MVYEVTWMHFYTGRGASRSIYGPDLTLQVYRLPTSPISTGFSAQVQHSLTEYLHYHSDVWLLSTAL